MLNNQGYRHTPRICYTYYFSTLQWLRELVPVLCYMYIASFVYLQNNINQIYQIIEVTSAYCTFTVCIKVGFFILCNVSNQLKEIHGTDTFLKN